ncbi:MAG: hypothetical protein ACUBOA_11795 [Candidatus Loosdrechtia sp.]|uniref:hypothetical protein n=1 Tax=Candidatus Loosdrechtia sp. TaxID=3101272 RepID=UPI003A799AD6|nr:MAG: hypothetical protein QY305_00600 [Candidatus Jettenia sp. AMX2]
MILGNFEGIIVLKVSNRTYLQSRENYPAGHCEGFFRSNHKAEIAEPAASVSEAVSEFASSLSLLATASLLAMTYFSGFNMSHIPYTNSSVRYYSSWIREQGEAILV